MVTLLVFYTFHLLRAMNLHVLIMLLYTFLIILSRVTNDSSAGVSLSIHPPNLQFNKAEVLSVH